MPAKRRTPKHRRGRIEREHAAAFIAGEGLALMRALGLKPWQFATSPTAEAARSADEIMAKRDRIEAELLNNGPEKEIA